MPVNLNQYRGTIGVFNANIIMIKIRNRAISRLYFFCNTDQVSINIDIICLSKTYLDSTIQWDNDNLEIPGYNLVRSDHPSNNKRGGVCIYYKASSPLRVINICFLQECIILEIMIGDKQCSLVALYRSLSQNQDEFDSFSKNLEITLDKLALNNPFMLVVIGDLNAKSKNWYPLDRTTYEGNIIEIITSHFGLHQLIHDPTHISGKS